MFKALLSSVDYQKLASEIADLALYINHHQSIANVALHHQDTSSAERLLQALQKRRISIDRISKEDARIVTFSFIAAKLHWNCWIPNGENNTSVIGVGLEDLAGLIIQPVGNETNEHHLVMVELQWKPVFVQREARPVYERLLYHPGFF